MNIFREWTKVKGLWRRVLLEKAIHLHSSVMVETMKCVVIPKSVLYSYTIDNETFRLSMSYTGKI